MQLPVRRQYLRLARRALLEGKVPWLLRQGLKTVTVPLADRLRRPLAGPLLGNLVLTYRCNNACFMCDLPKPWFYQARGKTELDTAGMKRLIDGFARLGTVGLGFTGGEATVRADCFELLAHSAAQGMLTHLNTNAYALATPERVSALLDTGVESMNISLDGAVPATHDRLRKARGGFDRVARVTELVLAQRRGARPSVTYTFVVGPENHREVPAFVELARRRGVESITFIPLHGCYSGAVPITDEQRAEMDETIHWLLEEKERSAGDFFDNSADYLSLFPRSFRGEPSPLKCFVGYMHLLVDCYGNVYPCAYHAETGRAVANTEEKSLEEIWWGPGYDRARDALSACRECYWNCHTEMNLLYQRAPA